MKNVILTAFLISNLTCFSCLAGAQDQGKGLTIDPQSKKISIDYKEANLVSVLQAIAYSFNLNLVVTKDVQGKVSAYLQDITID